MTLPLPGWRPASRDEAHTSPWGERDLHEAAAFYEREGAPALAARFIAEFKRMAVLLAQQPEIGAPRNRGRRAIAMSIFPFTLVYRISGEEIKILVVKHDSRRPGYGGAQSDTCQKRCPSSIAFEAAEPEWDFQAACGVRLS